MVFTPKGGGTAIHAGKVSVTIAQAAVTITWSYNVESVNYTGKPAVLRSLNVSTPDGKAHPGTITYEYGLAEKGSFQPGLPQDVGTYYVRAAVAAAGNYQGAKTENTLKLLIQKQVVTLFVGDYARPYDGTAVTIEEIPKEARGLLGETLTGTWTLKGATPEMKELGTYDITLSFNPDDPNFTWDDVTIKVTVQPIDLSNAEVKVAGSYTYNATKQVPKSSDITVTLNGSPLPESEYELSYENNQNAGQAVVVVTGRNHHGGVARGEFTIAPIPLTITGVTVSSRKYDEKTQVQVESLTLEGILDADKGKVQARPDSLTATVSGADVGTYDTVTLGPSMDLEGSAKDNYTLPCVELTFSGNNVNGGQGVTITPAIIKFIAPDVQDKVYDGTKYIELHGMQYSTDPSSILVAPIELDVECESANAGRTTVRGTATVTSDNFVFSNGQRTIETHPIEITIKPLPVQIKWEGKLIPTYDGEEHSLTAVIANRVGDDEVTPIPTGNVALEPGTYWAKVTSLEGADKDNYTLSGGTNVSERWNIDPIDIADAEVTLSETRFVYDGTEHTPEVTVTLGGKTLTEGEDYSLRFVGSTVNAGTVTVVVIADNHYKNVAHAYYTIEKTLLTSAPDGTAYYTCPDCGYHDWTSTQEGYRCNHCGYLESGKQLAGYANVAGTYEPKADGIPHTGDEGNASLSLSLLALGGTALAATTIIRRKRRE